MPPDADAVERRELGVFAYCRMADGRVVLSWRGRDVAVLDGLRAQRFLERVHQAGPEEAQRLVAHMTGRF